MTDFLEWIDESPYIQAITISKLLGITNTAQYLKTHNIDSRRHRDTRTSPYYVSIRGASEMLIKRNFGKSITATNAYSSASSDAERVVAALSVLDAEQPGKLDLKAQGRKTRKVARSRLY